VHLPLRSLGRGRVRQRPNDKQRTMEFQAPFRDVRIPRGTWGLWLVVVSLVLEIPGVAHAILRM